jgi:hypothetical protein
MWIDGAVAVGARNHPCIGAGAKEGTPMGADGESNGLESPVSKFTTPATGERIVAYPQPK